MKIITDVTEANNLLHSYIGAILQIAFYSESLKRIAIRICLPDVNEVVYLVGVGCESISGRFSFSNIHLSIVMTVDDEMKETLTKISDITSGFQLVTTGGFSLAQGYESEFGESFDDFLKDG